MKELKAYVTLFIVIVSIGTLAIVTSDNDDEDQNFTDEIVFYEIGDF